MKFQKKALLYSSMIRKVFLVCMALNSYKDFFIQCVVKPLALAMGI